MTCPNCGAANTGVYIKQSNLEYRPLPQELRGMNINRRRRTCSTCNQRFWTIEMVESEFDKLKKPPGVERETLPKLRKDVTQ